MSVIFLEFNIMIHGVDCKDDVVIGFLEGWLKDATYSALKGNMRDYFNFRDEFEDDIEVECESFAGNFEITEKKVSNFTKK